MDDGRWLRGGNKTALGQLQKSVCIYIHIYIHTWVNDVFVCMIVLVELATCMSACSSTCCWSFLDMDCQWEIKYSTYKGTRSASTWRLGRAHVFGDTWCNDWPIVAMVGRRLRILKSSRLSLSLAADGIDSERRETDTHTHTHGPLMSLFSLRAFVCSLSFLSVSSSHQQGLSFFPSLTASCAPLAVVKPNSCSA